MNPAGHRASVILSNAEIADRLASLAQLLSASRENPYKIRAYHRAAAKIRTLSESIDELVRNEVDLTQYAGIGEAIAGAIREIVRTGTLHKLEELRAEATDELAGISAYPRLDPKRILRIYKKLHISTIDALRERLESGEIEKTFGARMAQHVRDALDPAHQILLYKADDLCDSVKDFLLNSAHVKHVEVAGDFRRRVEVIGELCFLVDTDDFASLAAKLERYGGRTPRIDAGRKSAAFGLSAGVRLNVQLASPENWGSAMIAATGSHSHLRKLIAHVGKLDRSRTEAAFYRKHHLQFIEPELREGHDEIERAARHDLPVLVTREDICGELHAHTRSSDGANTVEQMAAAAAQKDYQYIGITDHSQSLKIARGVSIDDLREQLDLIDRLNERMNIRILKSAEVDILSDGSLDYPDEILRELDYTVCSIHSRFALNKAQQTERLLRAMDNRYFNILGHATGRLLLKRPGYEIDVERVVEHAKQCGCFFEINSSPDRLDLSAENVRIASAAGVRIAISTDAHSTGEFDLVRYGIDVARRAGLEKENVLNCLPWPELLRVLAH